jgi:group I intron endonuclease
MIAYKVTNNINDMIYIGITSKSLEKRWCLHQNWMRWKKPYGLHTAMKELGAQNFSIEHIASAKTFEDLKVLEKKLIQQYNSLYPNGYNKTLGGQGSLGYKHTEQTKKIISQKRKAAGPRTIPREAIERSRITRTGKKRTDEQKKKMALGRIGKGLLNDAARKHPKETLQLALQLLKSGEKSISVALTTGLSPSYVSNLKTGKRGLTLKGT